MSPTERTQQAATSAAAQSLIEAADFAERHICKPLFEKRMPRIGGRALMVRLFSPGILRVSDPETGEVLAESVPGNLRQLSTTPTRGS